MGLRRQQYLVVFPSHGEVGDRILAHLFHARSPLDAEELYRPIADDLRLTTEQQHARRGNEPAWHYHVRRAKRHLVDAGLVHKSQREPWSLTEKGHAKMKGREDLATEGLWQDDD